MTLKTVIELLRNEAECVKSADACDRDCGKCSLVKPTKDILEMYETAINVLEKLSCKNCIYLGHAFDIERLSSAQPDIIHCKDCKWKNQHNCTRTVELFIDDDKYCAWAERKTNVYNIK